MDHFVECIQTNTESHCNLDDAIVTHEIAFAALQCYETGQPVEAAADAGLIPKRAKGVQRKWENGICCFSGWTACGPTT